MKILKPQIIVLTPVRNEAWVLKAFLTCTSLWADKIIIADQMSTDGSRELYKLFPKVQVIDNDRVEMHMAATRRLLHKAAQKIPGDKIIFTLDTDEFLSGDFVHTDIWHKILNSRPNDAFGWQWMNLKAGDFTKYSTHVPYDWAVHASEDLWEGKYPDNFIHESRLPWTYKTDSEHEFITQEFYSIHLARVNQLRQRNKERFYQVSSLAIKNKYWNFIKIYRMYHREEHLEYFDVPQDAYKFYEDNGIDFWSLVDLSDEGVYYTEEIIKYFERDGLKKYALLDIWDDDWCLRNKVKNPQKWYHKILLNYLRWSNSHINYLTKGIDKIFNNIYKLF